jgi:ribokinase
MVNEEGENCIVVAPGANALLLPVDIAKVKKLSEAEIILMQLEIPMDTIEAVAKIAKANHQKLIINPAPAQKLSDELLKGIFLVTPNETEAAMLTGIPVIDERSASEAAEVFLRKGVQNVVITLGKKGAYFQNADLKFQIEAPVVQAKDTTAAGDTFNGALTVAIMKDGMGTGHSFRSAGGICICNQDGCTGFSSTSSEIEPLWNHNKNHIVSL